MKNTTTALLLAAAFCVLHSPFLEVPALRGQPVSTITKGPEVKLSPVAFGYNAQTLSGPGWDKKQFLDRIAELKPGNIRYPGGTVGSFWDWKTGHVNEIGRKHRVMGGATKDNPYPFMLEDIKKVYDRSGGKTEPIYMLNMLTATLEDQLEMLRHAKKIGLPVRYIEMGNEFYMDDHPKNYNYLIKYPKVKDYADDCRVWVNALRKEFPDARYSLIGLNNPESWNAPNRARARDWNKIVVENLKGFDVEAFTYHNYAKNKFQDQTPEELISQAVSHVNAQHRRGIPAKYPYWVTEYNFFMPENKNPGLWTTGLASLLMTAEMLAQQEVELVCFFNLTSSGVSTAIYHTDIKIAGGATAKKYALSASGQCLKAFAEAQLGAKTMRRLNFSNNPKIKTRHKTDCNTLFGYLFTHDGSGDKALLVNVGAKPMTVDLAGLGFEPKTAEHTWAPSLSTPIIDDNSVKKETTQLTGQKRLTLKPYSVAVLK